MTLQTELRQAERAMDATPIQGVLACMGILGRFPRNPGARRLLSTMDAEQRAAVLRETDALCRAGHWLEALQVLAPIGRAHPADVALAQAETRCLFNLDRFAEIPVRLEQPMLFQPDHPALTATLGTALYRLGQSDRALPLLASAARARPDDPHIANHLGLVLRATGRTEAARDAFRTAISVGGGLPEAWPNLAHLVDFRAAPGLVTALDDRLRAPDTSAAQTEYLAFARAKAAFDLGQDAAAFDWLARANGLHRAHHRHDAAAERRRVLDLAARLPAASLSHPPGAPRIVLVVGMPRSGTTLVEQVLAAHPQVEGLGECPHLAGLVSGLDTGQRWTADNLGMLAQGYHQALSARRSSSAGVVIDKMPSNALLAGFALAALPDARVVHVTRDPVATALSNLRLRFTASNDFAYDMADIAARLALTEDTMTLWRNRFPDRVHSLRLDPLTARPRAEIARLLRALDLPADESCLGFTGATGDIRTASAHQVRRPITPQASADWKRYAPFIQPMIDALAPFTAAHRAALASDD